MRAEEDEGASARGMQHPMPLPSVNEAMNSRRLGRAVGPGVVGAIGPMGST